MVLTVGLLCTVIGGTTWQKKTLSYYGYVYLRLKLLFGWLKTCNRRHHAVPLSVADLGGRGRNPPLESNFFFSFLFNFNSTVHPTPNSQPLP